MKIYILKQRVSLEGKRMTVTTIEIFVFDSKISRILGKLTQKIEISRITDDQFPQTTVALNVKLETRSVLWVKTKKG